MKHQVEIQRAKFETAAWSKGSAKPGSEVDLTVKSDNLPVGSEVLFEIHDEKGPLAVVTPVAGGGEHKHEKWKVPNTFAAGKRLFFNAILREPPGPKNGHVTVRKVVKSGDLTVDGFSVVIDSIDEAFVPGLENLEVVFTVTDPNGAVKRARIEVWGEKYPTDEPLHAETISVGAGQTTWNAWDGTASAGDLNGKLLTPEFTPYRVRVIVGAHREQVKHHGDPAKGKGRVAVAERAFEVTFEKVIVRMQPDFVEGAAEERYKLKSALAVEKSPAAVDGTFKDTGRLPLQGEKGRVRVAMEQHLDVNEQFTQAPGQWANGAYTRIASTPYVGDKKYDIDQGLYRRAEIPVEFEPRLRSRDPGTHPDGRFQKNAIGPLRLEPFAEDHYEAALYGASARRTYWKNADHRIKRGAHDAPVNAAGAPIVDHWQARFVVAADNDRLFDVSAFDASFRYQTGNNELTVYLNRARLILKNGPNDNDYEEVNSRRIRLSDGLTKAGDVVWVVRRAAGAGVPEWNKYLPGTNCHVHYGGLRAAGPNNLFLADYSGNARVGQTAVNFPYRTAGLVDLAPDTPADPADRERVRVKAIVDTGNTRLGLSGIVFSPSFIGGDSYVLHARVNHDAYERNLGAVARTPWNDSKTGVITVWRWLTVRRSVRMPDAGMVGLAMGVGSTPDAALAARPHPADGRNMAVSNINVLYSEGYNEWTIAAHVAITAATNATPIQITAPAHGLQTGDTVMISGVTGNTAANGSFVAKVTGPDDFTLHSVYDFKKADGVGAGVAGNGAYAPVAITAATNASPIEIRANGHGLATGDLVTIAGVGGNTAANGLFTIDRVTANRFTLRGSDGTASGAYTNGGQVCTGHIDVHRGVNLKRYRDTYKAIAGLGQGKVPMKTPAGLQMEFTPFDHYRVQLPPAAAPVPKGWRRRWSRILDALPAGTSSQAAMNAAGAAAATAGPSPFHRIIPTYVGTTGNYNQWIQGITDDIQTRLLNALAPGSAPPRAMAVLRWPRLYHHAVWIRGTQGAFATSGTYCNGFCNPGGNSFFENEQLDAGLFEHEMGHSVHLAHFVGMDFNWKHHDMGQVGCLMSYTFTTGYIIKPVGAVGLNAGTKLTGWPDVLPTPVPNYSSWDQTATPGVSRAIELATGAKTTPCAKCALKVRGWNDEVLPCAWTHPDLF